MLAINTICLQNFKFQAISKSNSKADVMTDIWCNSAVQDAQWVRGLRVVTI